MPYPEAKNIVHQYKFKSEKEWRVFCKSGLKPDNIPSTPANTYKLEGWESIGEWLGTNYVSGKKRVYLSFEESKKIVIKLKLKGEIEWRVYCKSGDKPSNIPAKPERTFKDKWHSWGNWLGTNSVANYKVQFLSFHEAKIHIHDFNVSSFQEWKDLIKSEDFIKLRIPKNPPRTYSKEWEGWEDFFGPTYSPKQNNWLKFHDLKKLIKKLRITSKSMYRNTTNEKLPYNPDRIYKSEWKGWADFLGKEKLK